MISKLSGRNCRTVDGGRAPTVLATLAPFLRECKVKVKALGAKAAGPVCVVWDIDQTLLISMEDEADTVLRHPQMYEVYMYAQKLGYKTFIVTARPDTPSNRAFTVKELHSKGFYNWDGLYLIPDDDNVDVGEWKTRIRRELGKQYVVCASVGDNDWDLFGREHLLGLLLPVPRH